MRATEKHGEVRPLSGGSSGPSPQLALGVFTEQAAWVAHEESQRGSLAEGKMADFVVLDRDPLLEPDRILDAVVVMTVAEGRVVFGK